MQNKFPKDNKLYRWTSHVKGKMLQYRLSESLVKRVVCSPKRTEEGIAPLTIAVMIPTVSKKPSEIWVMYKKDRYQKVIISAWRYPGITPVGKKITIPNDIVEELQKWFGDKVL